MVEDAEKVESLNTSFASVFIAKARTKEPQTLEPRGKFWRNDPFSFIEMNQVRDNLDKFDTHKFMGPDSMHALELRELAYLFCLSTHQRWETSLCALRGNHLPLTWFGVGKEQVSCAAESISHWNNFLLVESLESNPSISAFPLDFGHSCLTQTYQKCRCCEKKIQILSWN